MHLYQNIFILLGIASFLVDATNIPVIRRQDVATTTRGQAAFAHTTTQPNTLVTSIATATDGLPATLSTTMLDLHTEISGAVPTSASSPSNTSSSISNGNEMPIHPIITPAIAIAGVVLILTGMAYNLIGIKNLWLHVFLSAAFLTSLSIFVLIEYVMSPPVSNGVQGAYFVAIFCTGTIFGGLSLIFKELTEGLGCLLGGFCLSMWLLSLKSGGLLTSTSSKGAFIGAFCVVVYALSFSSYTRPYALIASTAFAGGTAAILGVDCFSRAGLKEFWLYNWGLNDNIFPLNTTTYPLNRGIRVELAAIIVICLFGLLSQFRLWKVIRERRQKQEEILAEEEQKKDEIEIELGRTIEERKMQDLARWEAVYGDHSKRGSTEAGASTCGFHRNYSAPDILQKPSEISVEMVTMSIPGYNTPSSPERNEREGENVQHDSGMVDAETTDGRAVASSVIEELQVEKPEARESVDTARDCVDEKIEGEPTRAPTPFQFFKSPPFNIPSPEERRNGDDDQSVQAIVDDGDSIANRLSKRLSAVSLLRRLSHRDSTSKISHIVSDSEEMLVPAARTSTASSVQGIADMEGSSTIEGQDACLRTEYEGNLGDNTSSRYSRPEVASRTEGDITVLKDPDSTHPLPENSDDHVVVVNKEVEQTKDMIEREGLGLSLVKRRHTFDGVDSTLKAGQAIALTHTKESVTSIKDKTPEKGVSGKSPKVALSSSQSRQSAGKKESLTAGAVGDLPSHVSPLIMSYRTNEWAKHLSDADTPDFDTIDVNQTDTTHGEITAPVYVEELTQTATTAAPPPVKEKRASPTENVVEGPIHRTSSNVSRQSTHEITSRLSPNIYVDTAATHATNIASGRSASNPDLLLPNANRSPPLHGTQIGFRNSSTQFPSTSLTTSPIDESQVVNFDSLPNDGSLSLLAQRERMVQARLSSLSLTRDSWTPRSPSRQSVNSPRLRPDSQISLAEDDEMTLAQRRALLQERATSPISVNADARRSAVDIYPVAARLSRESRNSSKSKSATMAAWRESIQDDLSRSHSPLADVDVARKEMMEQQRKAQMAKNQRVLASESLDNSIAERMRRGEMQDIHREAMRRMQAAANKKVREN
ncbi:hypothetical protein BGW36DRAFT_116193 [Talaromyces proteolyticus]|uniref:TM7S3/TM198-like domain-containing protein n=1 Tax=Talaromyces proteolyticus TaxID=1131652 RepID=A0AAD4PZ97_9EURO|nr:uncharacterized protein BGW36DRAFT_116193 [Talaromyces proteolyticus]KAH8702395.1 hypothetical protein BGW36DRAFT_116193 [Talaromyces proteolyticus]